MKVNLPRKVLFIASLLFFLSAACVMPTFAVGGQNPANAPEGQASEDQTTMVAGQNVEVTPTRTPTRIFRPTETLAIPTLRPSSTPLPTPTAFRIPKVPVQTCNAARFVADVTVPDGTDMPSGQGFIKTWSIKNVGTCTWDSDYSLVFEKGDAMGGLTLALGGIVEPGQTVEVSNYFIAPSTSGTYRGYWMLANAKGTKFGSHFYVEIDVVAAEPPKHDPRIRYDFAEHVCDAIWIGSEYILTCPGVDGSAYGFVRQLPRPILESGYIDNEKGLLTAPTNRSDGMIMGWFPPITLQEGDHFRSIVGCEHDAKDCKVRFELSCSDQFGEIIPLGSWNESYNEKYTQVDVDLSTLAGRTVEFYLTVYADGGTNNRALWLRPRILQHD